MKKTLLTIAFNTLIFALIITLIRTASSSLPSDVIAFEEITATPTTTVTPSETPTTTPTVTETPTLTPTSSPTPTPETSSLCLGRIKENSLSGQNSCPIGGQYRYATAICHIGNEEKTYQFNCPSNMVCCSEAYFYSHVTQFCCGGL